MTKQILEEIGNELIQEIRKRLATRGYMGKGIDDTGNASRSLNLSVNTDGSKLEIKGLQHIGASDKGRRPNIGGGERWKIETMMDWVERKLGIPKPKNKPIAYAIKQSIADHGNLLWRNDSRYKGLELKEVAEIGTDLIKKRITANFLIETKAKIIDLSKGATA